MLDSEIVADDPVDASAAIVKLFVGEDDENGILPLFATSKDCVASEQLQSFHCGFGQGNNTVVIVDGIGDPECEGGLVLPDDVYFKVEMAVKAAYISWLGFFFFLRIAVAVSSSYRMISICYWCRLSC